MNVVVISAHPDDETIGCGGTLLKHKQQKDNLFWIIVTKMVEGHHFTKERIISRKNEISKVKDIYGVKELFELGYETMKLDSSSIITMVPLIAKIFSQINPEIIYVVNRSDAHSDHRIVFDAVFACTKSFRLPSLKKLLMYECISETEFTPAIQGNAFLPNYYIDITNFIQEKLDICLLFDYEMGEHPFPRNIKNIEALATYRGAFAGVNYAEAFQVLKIIEK